jgi:hypothetical protein
MFERVKEIKTIAILMYYKNIILLKNIINFFNDINSIGYSLKISEDIVDVRMLKVCLKLENEKVFGFFKNKSGLKKKGYKKIIKRNYKKSNYSLVKITGIITVADKVVIVPMKLAGIVGQNFVEIYRDAITKNNISKEIKIQNNLSNSQFKNDFKLVEEEKNAVLYDHRVLVNGVKVNEDGSVNLIYFETVTSKGNHEINLNLSKEEANLLKNEKFIIPTISMPENKTIKIEDFSMIYKSAIKKPLTNDHGIKLDEKNVIKMPKGLDKELQERTDGFMEVVG